jgi:putative membrane protein
MVDGKVKVMAQRLGNYLLIVETSHPDGTEDIDSAVAEVLDEKVKGMGYKGLIFIDGHNCSSEHADETFVYSEKYVDIEKVVMSAAEKLRDSELYRAKIGIGKSKRLGIEHGIGPMGIISLVIEVDGQKTAYIVIDGNNMVRELRDMVLKKARELVDNAEVMTTDNHYVNRVDGGSNPVGKKGGLGEVANACVETLKDAISDLEDSDMLLGSAKLKLRVFGHGTPVKLVAVPESVSAMGKTLAFLDLLSMILLDVLLAILI